MKRRPINDGFILPAVVIVILVLTLMGMALLEMARLEAAIVIKETRYLKALNLAEAGLERGLWKVAETSGWTDGWTDEPLGDGTYSVTVEYLGGYSYSITSTGKVGTVSKTVTLTAEVRRGGWPEAFSDYALFWANPEGSGLTVRADNGALITGSIFAYGDVEIRNNAVVTGGELYATGTVSGGGAYTEGTLPDPLPDPVVLDTTYYDDLIALAAAQPPGDWQLLNGAEHHLNGATMLVNGSVEIANNCTLYGPGKIVATGDILVANNATVPGGVDFIAGGTFEFDNGGQIEGFGNVIFGREGVELRNNDATFGLSLAILTPGTLTLRENGVYSGVMYGGTVRIRNNVTITGSVYGNEFYGNTVNNVHIQHADPGFDPPPGIPTSGSLTVTPGAWAEQEAEGL